MARRALPFAEQLGAKSPVAVLLRKLAHGADLTEGDRQALEGAVDRVASVPAHQDLIAEGERPRFVHVVLDGFAYRYKTLPDGGRQILAWLVPGDFCDFHVAVLGAMDHNIATLSPSRIALIAPSAAIALTKVSDALSRALWWATLVDEAILRQWLVGMGRRSAAHQIAHLLCELSARLASVGLTTGGAFAMPVTQGELADAVGMSSVHVNRTIQELRDLRLIAWRNKTVTVLDFGALQEYAGFDSNYLHLGRVRAPERTDI